MRPSLPGGSPDPHDNEGLLIMNAFLAVIAVTILSGIFALLAELH